MADDFTERYGDLLTGSYDCVDRIVLNAYCPLGHTPGGFRVWWRPWHGNSDEELDEQVSLASLAERLRDFVDLNPDFETSIDRLATWLARLDDDEDL